MAHSKEPWREGLAYSSVVSDDGERALLGSDDTKHYGGHLVGESIGPQDRRRIIACVNLMAGVSTEDIEEIIKAGLENTVRLQALASMRVARYG